MHPFKLVQDPFYQYIHQKNYSRILKFLVLETGRIHFYSERIF